MKKLLFVILSMFVAIQCAFAVVNINTATQAELEGLSGIGPAKAKAILDDRVKNGVFKTIDDLKRVKGIGHATFEKLRKDITVSGAAEERPATKKTPK